MQVTMHLLSSSGSEQIEVVITVLHPDGTKKGEQKSHIEHKFDDMFPAIKN